MTRVEKVLNILGIESSNVNIFDISAEIATERSKKEEKLENAQKTLAQKLSDKANRPDQFLN